MLDNGTLPTLGRKRRPHFHAVAASAAMTILAAVLWLSTTVHPGPAMHDAALFAHLAFLTLGFGAVLATEYSFVLWALGRSTFADAVASATRLHVPIWLGLTGLVASGALLSPDLTSGTTILKLVLVGGLTLNGVQAGALTGRLSGAGEPPPARLLLRGAATSAISQVCWWGAVVIGFLHANR
ncbi:hypothetical protein Asp14428_29280 [Actinoplanes sp. NBRC 14428]|uniref:Uncharacterized protein n=1 Tax=Pseudosporangium ferrugineum TaxID=439699 RepID=A0A2T0RRW1_9ACTN|nr:hypothetical protein [Pseudosporangium ferrugineum]PRY23891.1 hypothetical protein CLV70_11421 [Pseudosporangium ferrugineum]BCJ51453.1 hypothetical protein Asp14428_29280 [Actinoplanes sp. NBRC 14428]